MKHQSSNNSTILQELLIIGTTVLPIIYLLTVWNNLPEEVPIHWNWKGEIDGYGSKSTLWWLILIMNVLVYLLMLFLPKISAKSENIRLMGKKYNRLRLILQLFMSALVLVIILASAGTAKMNIEVLMGYCFIFFMLLFGNYMGSIRQNHFFGIRTPWTLENEEVWKKTHYLGGRLWVGCALSGIILFFFLPNKWILTASLLLMVSPVLIATAYSFILFKQLTTKQ